MAAEQTKTASRIARAAGRTKPTDSPVASLPSRATTASATAAAAHALRTGNNFTGQYLYDRLIGDEQGADLSKMELVRQMLPLTVEEFGKAVGDFVAVAKGYADNAVDAAKKELGAKYDEKNPPFSVADTKAKLKTAQNHQTVMRVAYGSLKFAEKQLAELGVGKDAGYRIMRELGAKALDMAGLKWDGTKAEPKPTAEEKALRQQQQEQARLFTEAMAANRQKEDEDRAAYFERLDKIVSKRQKELAKEQHEERVAQLAKQVRELVGDSMDEVINLLLNPADAEQPEADKNLH